MDRASRAHAIARALLLLIAALLAAPALAQDGDDDFPLPSTPPEPVRLGPWISTGTVEIGYRFTSLDGSRDAYRSVVDLPQGPVLAFSRIELRAPENEGPVFDELTLEAVGGGGEPVSSYRARAAKRSLYTIDYRGSRIDTFNLIPDFANPLFADGVLVAPHGWDRSRRLDALDVTIFPERRIEGRLSYFRSDQSGLGLGTDIADSSLVFDRALDNRVHEVRGGVALRWPKWYLFVEQGARFYEDDERDTADPFTVTDEETLANFFRIRETEVDAPTTRAVLTARPFARIGVTAKAVYVDYDVRGRFLEVFDSLGSDPAQSEVLGRDEGHAFLFDTSQDVAVTERVRVTNHFRYRRYRTVGSTQGVFTIAGDEANAVREDDDRSYRDVHVEDEIRLEVRPLPGLVARAGYRFAEREFAFTRTDTILLPPPIDLFSSVRFLPREETQRIDVFLASGSYRFRRDARLFVEYENGREPNPNWGRDERAVFFDKAGDYQLLRVRGSWAATDWLEFSGSVRSTDRSFLSAVIPGREAIVDDPFNPVFVRLFDGEPPLQQTRSRAASVTVRARPWSRASFGVTYDHLRNTAGITYLDLVESPTSETGFEPVFRFLDYVDDEELVTADLVLDPTDRVSVTVFYSLVNAAGSLPLHYHQASVRGTVRLGAGVSGVLEWRLYDYDDHRYEVTDFRASHAIAGLRWQW